MKKRVDLVANLKQRHYPDILDCMAQISPNEVPTPPKVVQDMLAMLPQELFTNPNTKFLDPCSKSAVFLREIARKLIDGLADKIPNLQERLNHIFTKQLYGLSITELTGLVSRRTLYCSKEANSKYSVCKFDDSNGNIFYERIEHKWDGNKCLFCGASKKEWNRGAEFETHAYSFIHSTIDNNPKLFKRLKDMKFDVIIGNPPYQLNDGGAQASASPLYHLFVEQAKKLNPRYITMIIPSRWFAGGKGLDEFRDSMLKDTRLRILHDFPMSTDCFSGVLVKGGVCYFLWDRDNKGDCLVCNHQGEEIISQMKRPLLEKGSSIFIRHNEAISILRKVLNISQDNFAKVVSPLKPFGLRTFVKGEEKQKKDYVKLYENGGISWIARTEIPNNQQWIRHYKIYISRAYGAGEGFPHQIINQPILGEPNTCCTETYLHIGPFQNLEETKNALDYMKTKFFRFLVMLRKNTQDAPKHVYQFVPMQDFSQTWTDEKLYKKYGLNETEINFIESMIKPMA